MTRSEALAIARLKRWPADRQRAAGVDRRGYRRVFLGLGHQLANSGGWQYGHRIIASRKLGRKLRTDEHGHHRDGALVDGQKVDESENIEVQGASEHGRLHALERWRGADGRFVARPG